MAGYAPLDSPALSSPLGTIASLCHSVVLSVALEFLEVDPSDWLHLLLVCRTIHAMCRRFVSYIRITAWRVRRAPPTFLAHRHISLVVEDPALLGRRMRTALQQAHDDPLQVSWVNVLRLRVEGAEAARDGDGVVAVGPEEVVLLNRSSIGYDSDGVTTHLDLDANSLPLFPSIAPLYESCVRRLVISEFTGSLYTVMALLEASTRPWLKSLTLQHCCVGEASLWRATLSARCPERLVVVEKEPLEMVTRYVASSPVQPHALMDSLGEVSERHGPKSPCQYLQLPLISANSLIPACGVRSFRAELMDVTQPASWDRFVCPWLVRLQIDKVLCDANRASLDLDFSQWKQLQQVFVGYCDSITALVAGPSLVSLHLHHCTIHFRGRFAPPHGHVSGTVQVLLTNCHGASPKFELQGCRVDSPGWSGKSYLLV